MIFLSSTKIQKLIKSSYWEFTISIFVSFTMYQLWGLVVSTSLRLVLLGFAWLCLASLGFDLEFRALEVWKTPDYVLIVWRKSATPIQLSDSQPNRKKPCEHSNKLFGFNNKSRCQKLWANWLQTWWFGMQVVDCDAELFMWTLTPKVNLLWLIRRSIPRSSVCSLRLIFGYSFFWNCFLTRLLSKTSSVANFLSFTMTCFLRPIIIQYSSLASQMTSAATWIPWVCYQMSYNVSRYGSLHFL